MQRPLPAGRDLRSSGSAPEDSWGNSSLSAGGSRRSQQSAQVVFRLTRGIVGLIRARANSGSFGLVYPEQCPVLMVAARLGTDVVALRDALAASAHLLRLS